MTNEYYTWAAVLRAWVGLRVELLWPEAPEYGTMGDRGLKPGSGQLAFSAEV